MVGALSRAVIRPAIGFGGAAGESPRPRPRAPAAPPPAPPRPRSPAPSALPLWAGGFIAATRAFRSSSEDQRKTLIFTPRPASLTFAEVAVNVTSAPGTWASDGGAAIDNPKTKMSKALNMESSKNSPPNLRGGFANEVSEDGVVPFWNHPASLRSAPLLT